MDFAHPKTSILEQIATWQTLLPGQSLSFPMTLDKVVDSPPRPGTYRVSASYEPPFIFPSEHDALTLRGIDIPNSKVSSAALVYEVSFRQARR